MTKAADRQLDSFNIQTNESKSSHDLKQTTTIFSIFYNHRKVRSSEAPLVFILKFERNEKKNT